MRMTKQLKGCTCFSVSAIIVSAIIFIFGVAEIVYISCHELQKKEATGPWPFDQRPGYVIFIAAISFLLPPFPLVIASVAKRQRLCILWACFFLVACFTSLLVFGAVTIRTSQKDLSEEMFGVMKCSRTDSKLANWISLLQYEYKCCGVTGYSDWSLFLEDRPNISVFPLPAGSVPYTCCRREHVSIKTGCGNGVLEMDADSRKNIIYTRPCGPVASKVFQGRLLQLGLEMLVAGFAAVISAIFLYCGATDLFCFGSTHRSYDNDGDTAAQVESRKLGGSDLSFHVSEVIDENENVVEPSDTPQPGLSPGLRGKPRIRSSREIMRQRMQQNGRVGRRSVPRGQARIQQASPNDNRTTYDRNSSPSKSRSRSSKGKPTDESSSKGSKFQVKALVKGRYALKDDIAERKKYEAHCKARHSRSYRVKDVNANPTRNNLVETLFKGIDMNSSVLSTIPTSHSHVNFPWTNKNGSRSSTVVGKGVTPSIPSMTRHPFLQGIKAAMPIISHFSSLPMFQINQLEAHATEQSPHFVHKTLPYPSPTLYAKQTYIAVPTPSFFKPKSASHLDDIPPTDTKHLETEEMKGQIAEDAQAVQELPPNPIIQCEENMTVDKQDDEIGPSKSVEVEIELEIEDETDEMTSSSSMENAIELRSSLSRPLSTIVEESESLKSSPEISESSSPKSSDYSAIGWEQSDLGKSPLSSSENLKSQQDEGDTDLVKDMAPSLERNITGKLKG